MSLYLAQKQIRNLLKSGMTLSEDANLNRGSRNTVKIILRSSEQVAPALIIKPRNWLPELAADVLSI